jgi:hypothetical protein
MKRAERSEGFLAAFYRKLRNDSVFSGRYYAAHSHPGDRFRPVAGRCYGRAAMTNNWFEAVQDAIHETDPDHAELTSWKPVLTLSKSRLCWTRWDRSGFCEAQDGRTNNCDSRLEIGSVTLTA